MVTKLSVIILSFLFLLLSATNIVASQRSGHSFPLKNAFPRSLAARDGAQDACASLFEENDLSIFHASDVRACTSTIPFNATVASQFLQYYKDTVVFQSTLAYLNMPTASYQQPTTNLLGNLDLIQAAVNSGVFTNEFEFEQAMLRAVYAAHEGHLYLDFGATAPFSFGSPYAISSVSSDGVQLPKPYLTNDLLALGSSASPISQINGVDAIEWLSQFAAENSFGLLDPNSDWNALMQTPAADVQEVPTAFTGASPFLPGDDLSFELANGTTISANWFALINVPQNMPPISNASDIYEFFVLGIIPDNSDSNDSGDSNAAASTTMPSATTTTAAATSSGSTAAATTSTPTATNWLDAMDVSAYPTNPVVVQPDLGNGEYITGYFLDDGTTAVLSIPSFEITESAVQNFSFTIGQFISQSKAAGKSKIVIDLQQNYGGNSLLAVDAFKQFFPAIDPFGGSRMRDSDYSNALGTTFTQFAISQRNNLNQSDIDVLINSPWEVLNYTNAESNEPFTSWPEFFALHEDHNDLFSTVQRDNLSNILFDEIATGGFDYSTLQPQGIVIYGYGNRSTVTPQPFAAEEMLILTDSICHSSCALFVEMLHHEAGVKTVVVGGRPNIGPMQAVAGTRGAASYAPSDLDNDIYNAIQLNASAQSQLPASHQVLPDLWIQSASFNLRDQIRRNEYFPLQFAYEAADCRIYWTVNTFNNFANLWKYAADALWANSSLCVKDSTVFTSNNGTDQFGPSQAQLESWGGYGSPSPIAVLPPSATGATAIPVAQRPDGQPIATATASASTVPAQSSYEETAHEAEDTLLSIFATLNKACDHDRNCNLRNSESCVPAAVCVDGTYKTQKRCKKQCVQSSDCKAGGLLICNLFDVQCFVNKDDAENCERLRNKRIFIGSGSRKSTVNGQNSRGFFRNAPQGFCEAIVAPNARCKALIDDNMSGSDSNPVPVGGDVQPSDTVDVNVPVSTDLQEMNSEGPIIDPDAAFPGDRVSDAIAAMFGS